MREHGCIVADTGPLIGLASIDRLELLRTLHGRVFVPVAVAEELAAGHGRAGTDALATHSWIEVRAVASPPPPIPRLHRGETEAIALAVELALPLLADDQRARVVARTSFGLKVQGTVGLLVVAKQRGYLTALRPELDRLRAAGRFLDVDLVAAALALVGEQ